jgi:hypothetical protein
MAYTTINKSTDYFNTVLYTSNNGSSPRTISGVGFQPDFVWVKNRDSASYNHVLNDSVRGLNKILSSDTDGAELAANHAGGYISSANNDGFVITAGSSNLSNYDTGTNKQVVWNWKANGQGSSNTDGSINTTYTSANTTAGFSIISYTGAGGTSNTLGHGLGVKPKMFIVKCRSHAGEYWGTWIDTDGDGTSNYRLSLNVTDAAYGNNPITFSNSTITLPSSANTQWDGSGRTYVGYCFAEKKGYSKFGSYTGNGNADGPFIYTGFKPAFILSKKTNAAGTQWTIWDNKRSSSGFNPANKILHPNVSNPDNTADDTDFLSNGFKLRATASGMNNSGDTYIYMAIGQSLVGSNDVPCTAR